MRKVTLDTNALYDLENDAWAPPMRRIVEQASQLRILLQVPAIAASERQQDGSHLDDFGRFQQRLSRAGIEDVKLLLPMGYADICYYDRFVWSGPDLEALECQIHEILFPSIAFVADEHCPVDDKAGRRKWRNAKCDVQSMWCHIYYGGDVFVTRDGKFLRSKKPNLQALGAGLIVRPEEAVAALGL